MLSAAEPTIRFNRDIRPILNDKCLACHGHDAKKVEGDVRLDLRDVATKPNKHGHIAIVPGDPDKSELIHRIFAADEKKRMPPPEAHKALDPQEQQLLREWIAQGAEYEPHWAYTELHRPAPPNASETQWVINPIDQFIAARREAAGVEPSPSADRITLIRRLSFDLTGLPPTPAEVDAFVGDSSANAYEKVVDRLLASPRFGERMAVYWLDLVRYADTVGYHGDQDISQSPYRDYVINAFNANMPFDRFVREQLAGDLLPNATLDQIVASGYNRLNQTTEEGGAQPKEYLAIYFADRVRNVSQVFMGATMGCAQCHDHKYDPYTARDFYSMGAFFADVQEEGKYGARRRPPEIPVPTNEQKQQLETIDAKLADANKRMERLRPSLLSQQGAWEENTLAALETHKATDVAWIDAASEVPGKRDGAWNFIDATKGPIHSGAESRVQSSNGLVQHFTLGAKDPIVLEDGNAFYAWVYLDAKTPPQAIMLQFNDGGWEHRAVWGGDQIVYGKTDQPSPAYHRMGALPAAGQWVRLQVDPADVGLKAGAKINGMAFTQFGGTVYWDDAGVNQHVGPPDAIATILKVAAAARTDAQRKSLEDYYLDHAEPMLALRGEIESLNKEHKSLEGSFVTTPITVAVAPRVIRILPRGNWMNDSGDIVEPAVPAFLGKLNTGDKRATRLDLANWLCEADNPLTSRTMANRLWYLMFGRGICTSVDDLGGQGTYPSHPELLDWLSVEFVESGWNIKHMLRLIVTSNTYRQSSRPTPKLRAEDPFNDLFARQGRYRIAAEMVRDNALSISGLLVEKVGGVSVKPYQPGGYYDQLNFPRRGYAPSKGEDQYRRGVYTHWQRTFLHPMLKAFDAPSREECTAQRARSNTPLQALTLLNDPTFVECARVFAARIMHEGGATTESRLAWGYRHALSRPPGNEITEVLRGVYENHLAFYREHTSEAKQLIAAGDAPADAALDPVELAAWTSVARVVLNLNETITRY
ncbi:MAG: DUF1553 domain-containing protein [Planctomycetes bacterium]|nr:DUF1553 domain-containing protein [Planctomycetota bacterium]